MGSKELVKEFEQKASIFSSLESMTSSLLNALITQADIPIHSVTSRTKNVQSLSGKINRPSKSYKNLLDITDLVGFRVTTYFSDDVDKIAALIEKEFAVDKGNSIDKRKALEPDRFGYMSLHLVGEHKASRLKLPEYKQYKGIRFEVQIRSILQHAWAEIEHDIGYKTTNEVPDQLRRRFSRLAGLLELADEEFQSIKYGIETYRSSLPERVSSSPEDVSLDLDSLEYFISSDAKVLALEEEMRKVFHCKKLMQPEDEVLSNSLEFLNRMGIDRLSELISLYEEQEQYLVPFLKAWLSDDGQMNVSKGISLLYLTYVNLASKDDQVHAEYVLGSAPFMNVSELAAGIKQTWDTIKI
ncbi:GTP pyrophosphokinase [Photobacterium leiognathi]|uniref:GTP pyrophosphokinase n=1 Tax=Photobacterium leiognathi TaxID=553611 RepID=UPI00298273B1|nr:hypothetical protein [Photobacterium leiognathi]